MSFTSVDSTARDIPRFLRAFVVAVAVAGVPIILRGFGAIAPTIVSPRALTFMRQAAVVGGAWAIVSSVKSGRSPYDRRWTADILRFLVLTATVIVPALVARSGDLYSPLDALDDVVLPSVTEELVFRGLLPQCIIDLLGRRTPWTLSVAVLLSALAFAFAHESSSSVAVAQPLVFSRAVFGVAVGWIALTTRSLLPGLIAHASYNAIVGTVR